MKSDDLKEKVIAKLKELLDYDSGDLTFNVVSVWTDKVSIINTLEITSRENFPEDSGRMMFLMYQGTCIYLNAYRMSNNISSISTLKDEKFYLTSDGMLFTPFGNSIEFNTKPDINWDDVDGLFELSITSRDVDEDYLYCDMLFDNEDTNLLLPLISNLFKETKANKNNFVDSFIDSYGKVDSYGNAFSEKAMKKIIVDIETGGFNSTGQIRIVSNNNEDNEDSFWEDIPKPELPKSDGKLFSV